jgi:hypothetical protein
VLERRGRFRLYRTAPACVLTVANSIEQLATRQDPPRTENTPPSESTQFSAVADIDAA